MDKKFYNIELVPGTSEADFLANDAAGMTLHDNLDLFDMLLVMKLTEDEAIQLLDSPKIKSIEPERETIPTAYPTSTPRYESGTVTYRTRYTPSTNDNGADYTGTNMYFTSEFKGASGFNEPIGYFGDYQFDDTVKTNFAGDYVDIVAIEAGEPASAHNGHEDHVDFEEWGTNNSKFVRMDWSSVNSSASSADNNQVTNSGDSALSDHAIGVLSAAGGKYSGWGKKSSLRVMYLTDSVSTAYYTVLQWHLSKSVNPVTGIRNATVVTGAWGYSGIEHNTFYPIESIENIEARDPVTNAVTTLTPGMYMEGQTFEITTTASNSSEYTVTGDDRIYYSTSANTGVANRTITLHPGDKLKITNNASGHPLYIKTVAGTGTGNQYSGATGNGTSTIEMTAPDQALQLYYQCSLHSDMNGTINISKDTSSWNNDFRAFTRHGIIPRVIEDPDDSTDKWMISSPNSSRYTTFDTIMDTYNTNGGIYHFKSAGNNSHIAVNPDDNRWNTRVRHDGTGNYVINSVVNQTNNFSSAVSPGALYKYPLRTYLDGGDNQFTIAACQQDDVNRLMDDYSNRGPMVDFAAYGAYTWTSRPTQTFQDGKWGYFSGTSCAAPVAAGCATVFIDWWYTQRGVYPSIAQLKELMINSAKENLIEETTLDEVDFENVAGTRNGRLDPGNITSTMLYSSTEVNRIKDGDSSNGGADLTCLAGTPELRIHIPWGVRMGSGKYIAGGSEQTKHKRRPTSGSVWPRRKVSFSS